MAGPQVTEDLANLERNGQESDTVVNAICSRFQQKRRIYTKIGAADLLVLNPWVQLPIYDKGVLAQYHHISSSGADEAHIFLTASRALKSVLEATSSGEDGNAALVFCGESGSGKTQNLFHALRYFAFAEEQRNAAEQQNILLNREVVSSLERILASLGGARMLKNDHSTRHGYALELHYKGESLVGVSIDCAVPLELARLVSQKRGERNFAVLYQLCCGLKGEQRERMGLAGPDNYFYLNQGKCQGLDSAQEAAEFAALTAALSQIGFSTHQQELIWRLLSAILHTGNIFFNAQTTENNEEFAELANEAELRWVALLLDVEFALLRRIFTHNGKGQRLSIDAALDVRDAFAKTLYAELFFKWTMTRISLFLQKPSANNEKSGKITLLDVPGFERYVNNGYEEFCSNLVNEQLERFFQQQRFGQFSDEELLNARPSRGEDVHWPSNERTMELLVKRPVGILPLLNDECEFPRGSDETFLQHCNINHLDKQIYAKARTKGRLELGVRHHFGLAYYATEGFLQRNRYLQPVALFSALAHSKDAALAALFADAAVERKEDKWAYVAEGMHRGMGRLLERLGPAQLFFVRCVRANNDRQPGKLDQQGIGRQLRALAVGEHCLAVRTGFERKIPIEHFANTFRALLPDEVVRGRSAQQVARDVLAAQGHRFDTQFVIGTQHVFLKETLHAQLGDLKQFTLNLAALIIQRNFRTFLARRTFVLKKAAVTRIQAAYRGWKCRRTLEEVRERHKWAEEKTRRATGTATREQNGGSGQVLGERRPQFKRSTRYATPSTLLNVPRQQVPTVSLEQFAAEHIKTILLGARREPIVSPFLAKDTEEEFADSLAMFKQILHYQREQEDDDRQQRLAKDIIQRGIFCPSLRDELFVQLLNQTHAAKCKTALDRVWTLLLCAAHAFPPSGTVFPVLYTHFLAQPAPLCQMLLKGLLKVANLPDTAVPRRTFAPSLLEQKAFAQRRAAILVLSYADGGGQQNVEVDGWTSAEELVQTALRERGIGDPFGWGLQLDDGTRCTQIASSLFPLDAIAQMEDKLAAAENGLQQREMPMTASPFAFFDSPKGNPLAQPQKFERPISNGHSTNGNSRGSGEQRPNGDAFSRNANFGPTPFHHFSQFSSSPSPLVRPRNDQGVHVRRQLNPNCMSRITEKEEDCVSTLSHYPPNGNDGRQQTNATGAGGTASAGVQNTSLLARIHNMPVPTSDRAVERFLDDVFEQALPPADYDDNEGSEEEDRGGKFDRAFVSRLAASIQGGDFYEPRGAVLGAGQIHVTEWERTNGQQQQPDWDHQPPATRFVYRPGGDGGGPGSIHVAHNGHSSGPQLRQMASPRQPPLRANPLPPQPRYQPNGEFMLPSPPPIAQSTLNKEATAIGSPGGLRRLRAPPPPSYDIALAPNGQQQRYQEIPRAYECYRSDGEEEEETVEGTEGNGAEEAGVEGDEEHPPSEWVAESEATLALLFSAQPHRPAENLYAISGRPKSLGSEQRELRLASPLAIGKERKKAAVGYAEQPFEVQLRKEMFAPAEVLDDALEIDLIFAQIIRDCRRSLGQMRIRKYEREAVGQLLLSYNVPAHTVNNTPAQIATNVKLEVISIVRKWPLYFCRLFPVIEERPNERVPLLLGVGETGIRLIAVVRKRGAEDVDAEPSMAIQDHFEFADIAELLLENGGRSLRLVTRQNIAILLSGPQMAVAKQCLEGFVLGAVKRRQFVIATADYSTREANVLSFEAGDYIQLIERPDSEVPSAAGQWLYGRLDGRFGWLPAEYVADPNAQEDEQQLYSASSGGFPLFGGSAADGQLSSPPLVGGCIPAALEPLFANIGDLSVLFLPDPIGAERFTMAEFAVRFFRPPKGANGKKLDWQEVGARVRHTDRPIGHSLLRLESHEADKVAQQSFQCIMRFMGDEVLKRHQSFTDCVYELLSLCHAYLPIRDEVFCQLVKQLSANRSQKCAESALRGWRLLAIVCAYFCPSETLKPYLLKFLAELAFDVRRTFHPLAKLCLFHLAQSARFGGRRLILGAAEVEAIANGRSVRRQWYHLPGGHRRAVLTRSVTVAEEIVRALCLEMNIRSAAEQQEFSLCYLLERDNSVRTLLNDEYVLDVCAELDSRNEDYLLILTRSVWLHPLRRDSELCTDALFFQLMPNYLAGLLTSLRPDGTATAATMEDVATLGALLLLSDPQNSADLATANLSLLVPKNMLNSVEWAQRIRARVDQLSPSGFTPTRARQQFLEIVERWPLFGAAFYSVRRVFAGKNAAPGVGAAVLAEHCVLAVNRSGVRVLEPGSQHPKAEISLSEIGEMAKYSVGDTNLLELRLSAQAMQKHSGEVVTVETELGNEISRLIGHYIFLSRSQSNSE